MKGKKRKKIENFTSTTILAVNISIKYALIVLNLDWTILVAISNRLRDSGIFWISFSNKLFWKLTAFCGISPIIPLLSPIKSKGEAWPMIETSSPFLSHRWGRDESFSDSLWKLFVEKFESWGRANILKERFFF